MRVDFLCIRLARQKARVQRHGDNHALRERANDRVENRLEGKAADRLHFRQMLVRLAERVLARAFHLFFAAARFVVGDHFLAAARITRD